jgi:UDP-3-O-[3-hydroxymyristoyl] glucosamine N-acyltransferase
VVGHCKVGEDAIVTPQSGVAHDIPAGALVSGAPAVDHKAWLKYSAILPKLPEMLRLLRSRFPKE